MITVDSQHIEAGDTRAGAGNSRIPADEIRKDAEESRIPAENTQNITINNIPQINIQAIILSGHDTYNNGPFIPVCQDAMRAIACNGNVKPGTLRILAYILGTVDENNCFYSKLIDIASALKCSEDTVERAIKQLVSMRIICRKEGAKEHGVYELSNKILNPRLAFKGNTRRISKNLLPPLLEPDSDKPLIPDVFFKPDY